MEEVTDGAVVLAMSTETAPEPKVADTVRTGTADGSPPSGDDVAQETRGQAGDEGESPESQDGGKEDFSAEVQRLRARDEEHQAKIAEYEEALETLLSQQGNGSQPKDEVEEFISKNWPEMVEDENGRPVRNRAHETMSELVTRIENRILGKMRGEIAPRLQSVDKTLNTTKFERTLADRGVDYETQRSPEFLAFRKQMERDPEDGKMFRTLQNKSATTAAKWLASEFQSRNGRIRTQVRERKTHEDAKNGRSSVVQSRGSATAVRQFVYNPRDPQNLAKLSAFFANGGTREGIVRPDKK